MQLLKTIVKALIPIVVVTFIGLTNTVQAQAPTLSYEDRLSVWIDNLEQAESQGKEMLVVLDTNYKYSYGCLQYQMATWEAFSRKYGINQEIMNCQAQKKLAMLMVTDDPNAWRNWYNSVTKHGVGKPPSPQKESRAPL